MELVHEQQPDPATASACDQVLATLARGASIELTPRQIQATDDLQDWLSPGTSVYVPFLPNADYGASIEACQRLVNLGLVPVPHFPARAIESHLQAQEWLDRLDLAGVRHLMVIAGDRPSPAGPFADSLALLTAGVLRDKPFALGVAGHPDGHPVAGHPELMEALRIKRDYAAATDTAMWVVTQFTFEADICIDWLEAAEQYLSPLPVYVGLAGPTKLRTLMAYAAQCGVGVSARALLRHPETARLLRAWTPDGLVHALARHQVEQPMTLFRGIHIFPFGGLKRASEWLTGLEQEASQRHQAANRNSL
ncbi:methylenetetrahydrofolate reductase [Marinobacter bohaiensis]|uniref:methylenetetrahydrofolate reductase n=1 Tax=Marinobacter bohaiensis TaxID=2201898 RepID=UPI000DABFB19|nr:methylenetetrahydrofolate reductase [Marinobacter bohaiensis]